MFYIGAALELLRIQGFINDRARAPNIAVVITDGMSADPVATKQQVMCPLMLCRLFYHCTLNKSI